jgi:hypothetical protein
MERSHSLWISLERGTEAAGRAQTVGRVVGKRRSAFGALSRRGHQRLRLGPIRSYQITEEKPAKKRAKEMGV